MTTSRRRWLAFSLRTLFVVVLFLSVPLGWLSVHLKWIHDRHEARKSVYHGCGSDWGTKHAWWDPWMSSVPVLPWSLQLLGEDADCLISADLDLESSDGVTKAEDLKQLFPEAAIVVVNHYSNGKRSYTWLRDPLNSRVINARGAVP